MIFLHLLQTRQRRLPQCDEDLKSRKDISYPVGELSKTKYVDQLQSFIVPHLSIYVA